MASRRTFWSKLWQAAAGALICALATTSTAHATDDQPVSTTAAASLLRETWVHAAAARGAWYIGNGTTWTPSVAHLQEGFRLRMVGALDGYRYRSRQYDSFTPNGRSVEHQGLRQSLDVLAGYQWRIGPWTLKSFIGVDARRALVETVDTELGTSKARGWSVGAKAVEEVWWHISDAAYASADLAVTSVDRAYSARFRLGWRPTAHWSLGPEVKFAGVLAGAWPTHTQRLGAFVRFDDGVHELSASSGVDWSRDQPAAAYATVQYLYRY